MMAHAMMSLAVSMVVLCSPPIAHAMEVMPACDPRVIWSGRATPEPSGVSRDCGMDAVML